MATKERSLAEEFREMRRAATPIVCVQTPDYRATIRELMEVRINGEAAPPVCVWDVVNGPRALRGDCNLGDSDLAAFMVLKNALTSLGSGGILFWVVPDTFSVPNHHFESMYTAQGIANLRDEFKGDKRTLVILSIDGKLPPLVADDVPLLRDPLPTEESLQLQTENLVLDLNKRLKDAGKKSVDVKPTEIARAAKLCRGMNRFASEQAVSMNLSARSGMDLVSLAKTQKLVIENTSERGLTFAEGIETYDDIGGQSFIKGFMRRKFGGKRPPSVLVRIEEIEKQMAGMGGDGRGAESTGTSDDQLGILLSAFQDNGWDGIICPGHPGTGKSHFSSATGNTFAVPAINMDLGAAKSKWIGESEGRIRKLVAILKSFAGSGAFFIATSNDITNIPTALIRRFRSGVFFFDLPTQEERQGIWKINLKRFDISPDQPFPDDTDFTGSDIRNICEFADDLQCSLMEASGYIIPVAKRDPSGIARLRESAHGKFLSASEPGPYRRPEGKTGRAVSL